MLEPIVAREAAANVTDKQIEVMQTALDRMREDPGDYPNFQDNNAVFQRCVYEAAGNPVLKIVMETLWLLVRDAEPNEHPMATRLAAIEMQQDVLDAMRERNSEATAAAMNAFNEESAKVLPAAAGGHHLAARALADVRPAPALRAVIWRIAQGLFSLGAPVGTGFQGSGPGNTKCRTPGKVCGTLLLSKPVVDRRAA